MRRHCPCCASALPLYYFGSRSSRCFECHNWPPPVPRDVPVRVAEISKFTDLPPAPVGVLTRIQSTAHALRRAGLSVAAIARRLDRDARAVEKLLARVRERLAKNVRGGHDPAASATKAKEAA